MNEITVLIYFICFAVVFGATFAFMWRMMTITLKDFDRVKNVHPELRDIKPGEELLVFQVKEEKDQNNKMSRVIKNNDGVAVVEGTPAASLIKDIDKFFALKPPERMAGEGISKPKSLSDFKGAVPVSRRLSPEEEAFAAKLNEDRLAGIQRTPEEETALRDQMFDAGNGKSTTKY